MDHINLLIKPASGLCNMRCKYCFYYDVMDHRDTAQHGIMTDEVLESMVRNAYQNSPKQVTFMFQGGEPTIAGLQYYQKFIQLVAQYNSNKIPTMYTIQTNGTLITREFASFFKQHNFLVGISIDGNEKRHNQFRKTSSLDGSFKEVKHGLHYLKEANVDYNILTVITEETVKHTESIYRYLTSLGTDYLQFIPCIDSFDKRVESYTLGVKEYGEFLVRLYDVWERDFYKGKRISIRYFDDVFKIILGFQPATCTMMGHCTTHLVVEADGSVYPCDFYVLDEYKLGSLLDTSFDELARNHQATSFIDTSVGVHEDCEECPYYQLCRGGCRRNKEPFDIVEHSKTKYCESYKHFFQQRLSNMVQVGTIIDQELRRGAYQKK